MNAMIFAAGLGTRLKPLTDTMPKALVPVAGKPLLQHVLDKLYVAGFSNIVVNVHHFANQIKDYLAGSDIKISDESDRLLETGGGLKKALPMFSNDEPVLIHNVDILSNVDLRDFYEQSRGNDATLLVSWRKTKRYLLFKEETNSTGSPELRLVGWTNIETHEVKSPYTEICSAMNDFYSHNPDYSAEQACPITGAWGEGLHLFAFSGIHSVSPSLSKLMDSWPDKFPIMDFYLQNCSNIYIKGVLKDDLRLMDVGKLDTLSEAEEFIKTI